MATPKNSKTLKKVKSVYYDDNSHRLTAPEAGLMPLFYPEGVAVIGATERPNSVGRTTMDNLIKGNKGNFEVYPINPKAETILGVKAYKTIADVGKPVDCAVVILPAKAVLGVTEQCGMAGCKSMIIITAGFKEVGPEGAQLELDVIAMANKYKMRVIGPNCLGLMMPSYGMNATFAARMGLEGSLAFISQSGAMCTAALDWSIQQKVGFSCFLSIGSMADCDWADIIEYLGEDPSTSAILIYMETIGNARAFLSAASRVTPKKPIVVIKAGKSDAAAQAAASHTGSLAGSHDAYLAAMKRCGVLCVDSIRELFDVANVIDKQPSPKNNKLTIVTNAGGPGVLATDATASNGGEMAEIDENTIEELNKFLPEAWSHANPVDVLGDANAECYAKTMEICLSDKNAGGVLVVLSPQSVTEPMATAKAVIDKVASLKAENNYDKPVICSWMGGVDVQEAFEFLNQNGVPCIASPDDAAKTFCQLWEQKEYTQLAMEEAAVDTSCDIGGDAGVTAMKILKQRYEEGLDILSEFDSKEVIKSFGIPIAETIVAETAEEAGTATDLTGFPAVVKLHSDTITHKSDVGGVILNVKDKQSVIDCFDKIKENVKLNTGSLDGFQGVTVQPMLDLSAGLELLAGSIVDGQFGPLVVFGAGGCMVEVYQDTCTAIPPLTQKSAKAAIDSTKISKALYGVGNARFPGVDMTKLQNSLIAFSNLVAQVGDYVAEIEINPLLALKDRMVALDARVVLRSKDCTEVPMKPIIRPYPAEYHTTAGDLNLKLLKTSDQEKWVEFIMNSSEACLTKRFHGQSKKEIVDTAQSYLDCDYDNTFAIGAFKPDGSLDCIFRMDKLRQDKSVAESFLLRSDSINAESVKSIIGFAKEICAKEGITKVVAATKDTDQEYYTSIGYTDAMPIMDGLVKMVLEF